MLKIINNQDNIGNIQLLKKIRKTKEIIKNKLLYLLDLLDKKHQQGFKDLINNFMKTQERKREQFKKNKNKKKILRPHL